MSLYDLRRRMKSVKSTKKITQAMELVATSKMRKLHKKLLLTRPYATASFRILSQVSNTVDARENIFFVTPNKNEQLAKTLIILITGDRGLCGSFNSNVFRKILEIYPDKTITDFVTIGRRGQSFCKKMGYDIIATFTKKSTSINAKRVRSITKVVLGAYTTAQYKEVIIVGTNFISMSTRKTYIKKILPINNLDNSIVSEIKVENAQYSFEPDSASVLNSLVIRLVEIQILQTILESNTSEQSARMMAMHEATQNAEGLTKDLILNYNNLRQELITRAVLEQQSA